MTHTPGPWAVREPESDELWEVYAESGGELISYPVYTPNQRANLMLIAAAPELLAACLGLLAEWREHLDADAGWKGYETDGMRAARIAITKAEGRE